MERAEAELSKGTSPFHKLGLSTAVFLRATLGFEKEVMEQAGARIAEAEEAATEHQRRAIKDRSTAHQSAIYPAGAEYALCHAESQLMAAVIGVLNESLTESLRGFYKLRKAFATLYELSEAEQKYLRSIGRSNATSQTSIVSSTDKLSSTGLQTPTEGSGVLTPANLSDSDDEGAFVDAEDGTTTHRHNGELTETDLEKLTLDDMSSKPNGGIGSSAPTTGAGATTATAFAQADADVDFRSITTDPIDLFIHSGVALCFGLLQLLLSMVPPAFAKLLSIFSFRGDREAGLRMLWSATKFKQNINGAMAGLITLGFYNGAIAFCDILMDDAVPEARLKNLLQEMRQLYPRSKLWLLEEARMLGAEKNLEQAIAITNDATPGGLKQIEALRRFERSLNCMYLHRYEECATGFIECVGLNSWSHALYYYIAGVCYVELYRAHKVNDPKAAAAYAEQAEENLHKVYSNVGKKGFMGRQLPFDVFVIRKLKKWDHRTKTQGCKFVDAVGVSPVAEMAYFWSGFKRMNEKQLLKHLQNLEWSEDLSLNPRWAQELADEKALQALLKATCLRFLHRVPEAKAMLSEGVLSHDLLQLKACDNADVWSIPVGHYEMAVCYWDEARGQHGDKVILQKCSDEIAKVEKSESYELEARVGLKVTTARETLRKCGVSSV
ncbi:Mitochondrial outer membrane protein iml2 [Recurvomyces mirabilis]|nr:Mitochondrial outer membrane protein iml2 [Recurvomyces mirabilis]